MTARILEAAGIVTVVLGSAYDIVTWCGVPRFYFNDLPLGNPVGSPGNADEQLRSVRGALGMVDSATKPAIEVSGLSFGESAEWKQNYMRIDDSNREALRLAGEENRRKRAAEIAAGYRRKT